MKYIVGIDLEDYGAWGEAKETLEKLIELGKCQEVENYINEFMEDATENQINDFLRFESYFIFNDLL